MRSLFDINSPLMQFLSRVADLIILNILTIVCCIPIVTIGAAMTALYDVTGRMLRDEGTIWKGYWSAFRANFKQATIIWLIMLVIGLLVGFSVFFYMQVEMNGSGFFMVAAIMVFLVWAIVLSWAFPLLARFENTVKQTLRNALFLGLGYLPHSVVMVFLNVLPVVIFVFWIDIYLTIGWVWLAFWYSMVAYNISKLLRKPFWKLIGTLDEGEENEEEALEEADAKALEEGEQE